MELIIVGFLLWAAARGLWHQTKRDLARWRDLARRRNRPPGRGPRPRVSAGATGYWAHQAAHGFPTARHGLHDGWTRGREAHLRAQQAIAQNRAEYTEGLADHQPVVEDLRERRRRALAELERQARERQEKFYQEWLERERERQERAAERERQAREDEAGRRRRAEEHDRKRERDGEPHDGGETEPQDTHEEEPRDGGEQAGGQDDPPAEPTGSEQGDGTVGQTETSYDGVVARMKAAQAAAEQRQAEAQRCVPGIEERVNVATRARDWASVTMEQLAALLVDAAVQAAMDDHRQAHREALAAEQALLEAVQESAKAWAGCAESAGDVLNGLQAAGHGNVAEATAAAAAGGAEREFYGEGEGTAA